MKIADYHWEHPALKEFSMHMPQDELLFRQGDPGNAMFIIVKGYVQLSAEKNGKEVFITLLQAGEFLGEQSLMNQGPYRRAFTARAKTELTVLRMSNHQISAIQSDSPKLMADILKGIFAVASTRLQRANRMIQLLRPSKNAERLVNLILYFCETFGREFPEGKEVHITSDSIRFYIDMTDYEINECLDELQKRKLLIKKTEEYFTVPDQKALRAFIPALSDHLPTLPVI